MTPEQLAQLSETIDKTIRFVVNGKIDRMNDKLDTYMKEDNEWKNSVTPSIEIMKKMQGFASTSGWILKGMVLVGSAIAAILGLIKFLKK